MYVKFLAINFLLKRYVNMRNKKSNLVYYIIAAVVLLVIGCAVTLEIPLKQEQVEITLK